MPTTYTATPDAVVSGGVVAITEPIDTDLASASSAMTSVEKVANVAKKLVNQALLAGVDPSILNANLPSGLLFASEGVGGVKTRIYVARSGHDGEFTITSNANWTNGGGGRWLYDVNTQDAYMLSLMGPGGLSASQFVSAMQYDTTLGNSWNDAAWSAAYLSANGTAQAAGVGVLTTQTPIAVTGGSGVGTYANGWGAYTTGSHEGVTYKKNLEGRTVFAGAAVGGASLSVGFVLPESYRPTVARQLVGGTNTLNVFSQILIDTSGNVTIAFPGGGTSTPVFFDGLSF